MTLVLVFGSWLLKVCNGKLHLLLPSFFPVYFLPLIAAASRTMLLRSPTFCFFEVLWGFLLPLSQRALATSSFPSPPNSVRINWIKPCPVPQTLVLPCCLPGICANLLLSKAQWRRWEKWHPASEGVCKDQPPTGLGDKEIKCCSSLWHATGLLLN